MSPVVERRASLRSDMLPPSDKIFEFFSKPKAQFKKRLGINTDPAMRIRIT